MIAYETQLKIQALLDDELSPSDARRLAETLAQDPEARALLAELKGTKAALKSFEEPFTLPETREFFWSKIERSIQAQPERVVAWAPLWVAWRRFLVPVSSLAALVLLALLTLLGPGGKGPEFEAALSDPGAFTYRDYSTGATLVWLSYPAENEFAQEEPTDTIE